jgi:hypothetical protein
MKRSAYVPEYIKPTTDQLQISPRITLAVGDDVKCSPLVGKSYVGKIKAIVVNEAGEVTEVDVFGGPKGRAALRTFTPDKLSAIPKKRLPKA